MVDKSELHRRIREEIDYVRCPKCGNSLAKFLSKNSEGVEDHVIARLLMISEEEVEKLYGEAIRMLKAGMQE